MTSERPKKLSQGRARAVQRAARGAGVPVRGEGDRAARGERAARRERRLRQVGQEQLRRACASCARCATARPSVSEGSSMRSARRCLRASAPSSLAARRERLRDRRRQACSAVRDAVAPASAAAAPPSPSATGARTAPARPRAAGLRRAGRAGDAARLRRRQPRLAQRPRRRGRARLQALAQANPELGGPHANLGVIYRQAGKLTEAVAELEHGRQAEPAPADLPEPARHRLSPAGPVRQGARRLRAALAPRSGLRRARR